MKRLMTMLAAALMMAGLAAAAGGAAACTPEAGDNRVTRWTQQNTANCALPRCNLQTSAITKNGVTVTLDVRPAHYPQVASRSKIVFSELSVPRF